jgi:hypothetical protein
MKYLMRFILWWGFGLYALHAAGSVTTTCVQIGTSGVYTLTYSWTGDASTGTVPATAAPCLISNAQIQGYRVFQVETVPGSGTAPSSNYTVTLTDANAVDYLAGQTNALSATVSAMWSVNAPPINGGLTLTVGSNSVASATGTVVVYLAPGAVARVFPGVFPTRKINTTSPLSGGGALSSDLTLLCSTCVVASSPGAGIAHFAGATQTATSSAVVDADFSGQLGIAHGGSGTATPGLVAGTNIAVTNTWPNQTISTTPAIVAANTSLTDNGSTIATNAALGNNFRVTALTANVTLSNPTNPTDGQAVSWEVIQNASAAKTLAFGGAFGFGAEITACTISVGLSSHSFITAIYNSTAAKWYVRGCITGY